MLRRNAIGWWDIAVGQDMAQTTVEGPEHRAECLLFAFYLIFKFSAVGTAVDLPGKKSLTNPVKGLAPPPTGHHRALETMSTKAL